MRSQPGAVRPWRAAVRELAGLVLPVCCPGCGAVDVALCPDCAADLAAGPLLARPTAPGCPAVLAAARYDGAVRRVLLAAKDRGRHDLLAPLGDALAAPLAVALAAVAVAAPGGPVSALVPVASSGAAARRRGGDHVAVLARRAAAATPGSPPVRAGSLAQRWGVRDQAGLGARARLANRRGAVRPGRRAPPAGVVVVLVDDVVTTGATLAASAGALRALGVAVPVAVVLAATPHRRPPGPVGRAAGRPPV